MGLRQEPLRDHDRRHPAHEPTHEGHRPRGDEEGPRELGRCNEGYAIAVLVAMSEPGI